MINIDTDTLVSLKAILKKHIPDATIWLFGSRATSNIKAHSDIDLAIMSSAPLSSNTLACLELEMMESDIPYKVDLVDWSRLDDDFKNIILDHHVILKI